MNTPFTLIFSIACFSIRCSVHVFSFHPNSKLVKLVQLIKQVVVPPRPRPVVNCTCCGKPMRVVRTRVRCAGDALRSLVSIRETAM